MAILVNIDVPDLKAGIAFYTQAFSLTVKRHRGEQGAELAGVDLSIRPGSSWVLTAFELKKPRS